MTTLQSNLLRKSNPTLAIKEIQDIYVRDNFRSLEQYFLTENQLLGFKFFEVVFTGAEQNRKVNHTLGSTPKDVVVTKITGTGTVLFNTGLFSTTEINISSTGPAKVRFFVGTYWNFQSQINDSATDVMSFSAVDPQAIMPTNTIRGRISAGSGEPENLTVAQVTSMLNVFTGDLGLGAAGIKGLVPAPAIGDASKFLRGDGTWFTISAGSGDVVGPASATDNAIAKFDGTTGKLIKNSGVTISSGNVISGVGANFSGLTASRATVTDGSKNLVSATATAAEVDYLSGVSSNLQTQLNNKQTLDATLTALAAYNTNGLLTQTAADTFVGRTLTGTANQVVISNGDGVSGNPTFSLPQSINTGATPTFVSVLLSGLTASRAVVSDASKNLISATATAAEVDFLSGVTSAIQTQLNAKLTNVLASASIFVGNGSNIATAVAMSGDISITNAGVTAYAGTVPLNKGGTGTAAASANAAFNALSPLTTKGDLIGFSTVNARLGVGTDGFVLTADAASTLGFKWATPGAGSYTAPKVTTYTSGSGTHTFTGSPLWVEVIVQGAGGGGGGSSTLAANDGGTGGTGGTSTVGSSFITCTGGGGGKCGDVSVAGGTATYGTATGSAIAGAQGTSGAISQTNNVNFFGAPGASSPLGGGGGGGRGTPTAGIAAPTNSGAGGGGAGGPDLGGTVRTGGGGSAGGHVRAFLYGSVLSGLSGSVAYAVGAAGTAGTAGTSGAAGGAGGSGLVMFIEHYQ